MKINTPLKQEEITNYTNVITSLVNSAILATEGVSQGDIYSRNKLPRNVGVFIDTTRQVTIDAYVDVAFGHNVSQVACDLQEKIINSVKKNTPLTVKNVNINIINVIFN